MFIHSRFVWILLVVVPTIGCDRLPSDVATALPRPSLPGVVTIDGADQERLGIETAPVQKRVAESKTSSVGWLELPPAGQTIVRAPVAGFLVISEANRWPELWQSIEANTKLAQVNVFLSPQEVSQLVMAKEDNDVQIQQAITTMKLSQSQLDNVKEARGAITGVRMNELKQTLAHAQTAFKEAKDKLPHLIQEPYENGLLVRPIDVSVPRAGRIILAHAVPGQFVQAGEPLWTVADWSRLWLRVPLMAGRFEKIAHDRPAWFPHDAKTMSLVPIHVPIEVKPLTRTVDLIYEISNADWKHRVGESMTVDLPLGFFLDFSGKGEVRFRSFDFGTGRWIFEGISTCVQ